MPGRIFRTCLALTLVTVLSIGTPMPAFAAERPVPTEGTQEYYEFISKPVWEQMEYVAGGRDTPEYRAFVEVRYRPLLQDADLTGSSIVFMG